MTSEVLKHNVTVLALLEPGDLIEFPRGRYSHWAVYIDNGEVVHLAGEENDGINDQFNKAHLFTISGKSFSKAVVKVEDFWRVAEGSKAVPNNKKDKKYKPLDRQEIVANALAKVGRVGYNVLFDNCEHFATWCRYGLSKSDQVDNFITGLSVVTAIAATLGVLFGLSRPNKSKKEEL